jgi:hypothetical protein
LNDPHLEIHKQRTRPGNRSSALSDNSCRRKTCVQDRRRALRKPRVCSASCVDRLHPWYIQPFGKPSLPLEEIQRIMKLDSYADSYRCLGQRVLGPLDGCIRIFANFGLVSNPLLLSNNVWQSKHITVGFDSAHCKGGRGRGSGISNDACCLARARRYGTSAVHRRPTCCQPPIPKGRIRLFSS